MPDRVSQSILDDDAATDWRAVAPGLGLRSIAVVALTVPLLLAAGVYWLHRLPIGPNLRANDSVVVEVQLLNTQGRAIEPQQEPAPTPQPVQPPVDTVVKDPVNAISTTNVAALPPQQQKSTAAPSVATTSAPPARSRTASDQKVAAFQRAVLSHIAHFWHPTGGKKRGAGRGIVQFSMLRDGQVTDVKIVSSSGYASLDGAIVETIRNAQPMPRIPAELPAQMTFGMPTDFDSTE